MLTHTELGQAIEAARIRKGIDKKKLADDMGVKPPSVQDWVKRGTIEINRLFDLMAYFSDVCGPDHWGLEQFPFVVRPTRSAESQVAEYRVASGAAIQLNTDLRELEAIARQLNSPARQQLIGMAKLLQSQQPEATANRAA